MTSFFTRRLTVLDKNTPKALYLLALALFIYMPFHVFLSQWLSVYTGGLDVWKVAKDGLTIVVTILFIALVYLRRLDTKLFNRLMILITGYFLLHVALFFATNQPYETGFLAIVYNLRIFAYLMIGYSLVLLFPRKKLFSRLSRILLVVSTIVCVFALLQRLLPSDILTFFGYSIDRGVKPNFFIDDKPDFPRVFGTLRDPNSFGAFLILPIVFLVSRLWQNWRSDKRLVYGGLSLVHLLALLLTFSRSTLLATILAVAVYALLANASTLRKHKKKIITAGLGFLLLSGGVIGLTRESYVTQNIVLHADESTVLEDPNELRVGLFKKGVDGVLEKPLGHGPGTAGLVSTRLPDGLLTENYYLQIAYEVGVFGLAIFMAIIVMIFKKLWQDRKSSISMVLAVSLIGLLFANLLFHTFSNEAVSISWFLLAGLALGSKKLA